MLSAGHDHCVELPMYPPLHATVQVLAAEILVQLKTSYAAPWSARLAQSAIGAHALNDPEGTVAGSVLSAAQVNSEMSPTCVSAHLTMQLEPAGTGSLQPPS